LACCSEETSQITTGYHILNNGMLVIEGLLAGALQDSIGWGIALERCITMHWWEEQDLFWKAFKSRKSSKRWTTALITCLITTAWGMWQHQNEALHESEVNQQEILGDAINQNICQAYAQGKGQLLKGAMSLMKWPLSKLLRLAAPYKQQWLARLEAVRAPFQC